MRRKSDRTSEVDASPSQTPLYHRGGKRAMDVVGSAAILAVAAPALGAVWTALRLTLGPDVVLRQDRIGLDGENFTLYKFRTMEMDRRASEHGTTETDDAETTQAQVIESKNDDRYIGHDRRACHKTEADPRHTPLGRIVRRFSLDELPQLVNVLTGDMSLVGPRPELAHRASKTFVAHRRHSVRPGLTGPFQVTDLRSVGDLESGLELDGAYADTVSLKNDLRFLAKTVGALARGTGS